jgi:multiple sugar transport system substrate-binding protein
MPLKFVKVAATVMYYNKDMFAKAGILRLPTNFSQFLAVCERLKKAGLVPIVWNGGFPNILANGPFSFGFANNVAARMPDWKARIAAGTLDLATPAGADIFAKIRLVAQRGYTEPGMLRTGYEEGIKMFTDGKAAMASACRPSARWSATKAWRRSASSPRSTTRRPRMR